MFLFINTLFVHNNHMYVTIQLHHKSDVYNEGSEKYGNERKD